MHLSVANTTLPIKTKFERLIMSTRQKHLQNLVEIGSIGLPPRSYVFLSFFFLPVLPTLVHTTIRNEIWWMIANKKTLTFNRFHEIAELETMKVCFRNNAYLV